jgi:hypothetical protein
LAVTGWGPRERLAAPVAEIRGVTSAERARAGRDRRSLYQEITDKIITELEAGRVPRVQPSGTVAAKASLAMPKNAATHRQYSGLWYPAFGGSHLRPMCSPKFNRSIRTDHKAVSAAEHIRQALPCLAKRESPVALTRTASQPCANLSLAPTRKRARKDAFCSGRPKAKDLP